ncbi:preprotein translocase subunit YajC [Haliovirga abyssi]|uniref:Preprotein translocase subunit YajC n=1 Tax=Haliovirga abyssi TaxID=2996794 RepID=A0AAU9DD37_9FUSO|nr:preprotein translocase subunit YajC [Haliovirga abyssi]BDU50078.1 hypothetical protein HLVA_06470 [Haliovirga abyssi]
MFSNILYAAGAATAPTSTNGIVTLVITVVLWGGIFYLLLVRPQKKRTAAHKQLMDSLKPGDVVFTTGGIKGEIISKNDEFIELRVDKGVKLTVKKNVISSIYKNK